MKKNCKQVIQKKKKKDENNEKNPLKSSKKTETSLKLCFTY